MQSTLVVNYKDEVAVHEIQIFLYIPQNVMLTFANQIGNATTYHFPSYFQQQLTEPQFDMLKFANMILEKEEPEFKADDVLPDQLKLVSDQDHFTIVANHTKKTFIGLSHVNECEMLIMKQEPSIYPLRVLFTELDYVQNNEAKIKREFDQVVFFPVDCVKLISGDLRNNDTLRRAMISEMKKCGLRTTFKFCYDSSLDEFRDLQDEHHAHIDMRFDLPL